MKNEIVLFRDGNINLEVPISPEEDTVWLSQADNWHINRTDVLDKMIKHGMIIAILRMILLQMEERTSAIGADWARRLEDDDPGDEGEKAGTGLLV